MSNQPYSDAFEKAVQFILPHEEDYVRGHWGDDSQESFVATENVAGDPGGQTRYGIDKASHPHIDIANLTRAGAIDIYHEEWEGHNMDLLPDKLAIAAFDVWVNGGHASLWLQHAYNEANASKPQLAEDGVLGPASIAALQAADPGPIIFNFIHERDARFEALAQRPSMRQFLKGWEQRDIDLEDFLST